MNIDLNRRASVAATAGVVEPMRRNKSGARDDEDQSVAALAPMLTAIQNA
jgi:hypothetical protein